MTLGSVCSSVVNAIASLSVTEAISLGLFVGGVGIAIYLWLKGHGKLHKKQRPEAQTPAEAIEVDGMGASLADILKKDVKPQNHTDSVADAINAELDEKLNHRNEGANHRYSKKSAKRDVDAIHNLGKSSSTPAGSKSARRKAVMEDFARQSEIFAEEIRRERSDNDTPFTPAFGI